MKNFKATYQATYKGITNEVVHTFGHHCLSTAYASMKSNLITDDSKNSLVIEECNPKKHLLTCLDADRTNLLDLNF